MTPWPKQTTRPFFFYFYYDDCAIPGHNKRTVRASQSVAIRNLIHIFICDGLKLWPEDEEDVEESVALS